MPTTGDMVKGRSAVFHSGQWPLAYSGGRLAHNDWVNRVPGCLPEKTGGGETWAWVDRNGNVFELGRDFSAAEQHATYPCRVYRLVSVAEWATGIDEPSKPRD